MKHPRGDRFGGVVFDVQQFRKGEQMLPGNPMRDRLIYAISELILVVENMDEKILHPVERSEPDGSAPIGTNPRIGVTIPGCRCGCGRRAGFCLYVGTGEKCTNTEHDQFGHRRSDCGECQPVCICKENDGRNGAPLCPVHEV